MQRLEALRHYEGLGLHREGLEPSTTSLRAKERFSSLSGSKRLRQAKHYALYQLSYRHVRHCLYPTMLLSLAAALDRYRRTSAYEHGAHHSVLGRQRRAWPPAHALALSINEALDVDVCLYIYFGRGSGCGMSIRTEPICRVFTNQ